jgi:hypothetical protein
MALLFPVIASTINISRYYHLMLLILAPGVVFGVAHFFKRWVVPVTTGLLIVYFIFTSGLVFQLAGYQDISKPTVPYSIALANQSCDAGNYLTDNDADVAKWAKESGYKVIYGDVGGTLVAQDYYDNYHALPLKANYQLGDIILVRTWNISRGWSEWIGPGLRRSVPMTLPAGKTLYQKGEAYIWEVE